MHNPTDFPALVDGVVTEAHARVCRERGHATWTIDDEVQPHCPRCGDLLQDPDASNRVQISVDGETADDAIEAAQWLEFLGWPTLWVTEAPNGEFEVRFVCGHKDVDTTVWQTVDASNAAEGFVDDSPYAVTAIVVG